MKFGVQIEGDNGRPRLYIKSINEPACSAYLSAFRCTRCDRDQLYLLPGSLWSCGLYAPRAVVETLYQTGTVLIPREF